LKISSASRLTATFFYAFSLL